MYADNSEELDNGKLRYLRPFIVLVPCLIVCLLNIKTNVPIITAMERLLITIVVFYFVGTLAQNKIRKMMIEAEQAARQREEERKESDGEEIAEDFEEEEQEEE